MTSMYGCPGEEERWHSLLRELTVDAAALLPRAGAGECALQRFTVVPRITPHVRHRAKYLDVPMELRHGFVFTGAGKPIGSPARTLRDFVTMLHHLPSPAINEHVRRGDFSRWIGDVFGDQPLAEEVCKVEREYRHGGVSNPVPLLIARIRARYEFEQV